MEAKITKHGFLEIRRAGKFADQFCPFIAGFNCGDWCPLFQENNYLYPGNKTITLCKGENIILVKDDRPLPKEVADESTD